MSYNSYKPNYRGRGGSFGGRGGGYRGSRGDSSGSWGGGGRGGRGSSSFSGSGRGSGRFSGGSSWDKDGVDSRSRYSGDYGGNDRYSSRGGRDDDSYGRRYSRQGGNPDYGNREHNHRGSPDIPRKRMRTESNYQGSSSIRRVHDDNYGNDYGRGGYGSFGEDKGGSGGYGERSRVYRDDRDHSRSSDYQYKKVMGPPAGPPRRSSPRGMYRGGRSFRGSRSSLLRGRWLKRNEMYSGSLSKRRSMMESSYSIRKKDYLRRMKLYKLKRLAERLNRVRTGKDSEGKKKGDKVNGEGADEDDDDDDDEEEIEVEEEVELSVEEEEDEGEEKEGEEDEEEDGEVEKPVKVENGVKKEDEELEEGETNEDGEVVPKKKLKKTVRKKVKKIVKKKIKKEKSVKKEKDESNENEDTKEGVHVTIKQDSESRAVNEEGRKTYLGRPYIRLDCRHCNIRCVTFKEYTMHLLTAKHLASMRKLALKLRQQLAHMRIEQRREQLILDAKQKDNPKLRTFFCSTCKLNHRSLKGEHMASMRHKKMREFLMPYCRVCRVTFRTPMGYENHMADLEHVKRAAKLEYLLAKRKGDKPEGRNVDMDNFMILDSVGSPDESEEEGDNKEDGEKEKTEGEDGEKKEKKKKKSEIKLGLEYCKKVEAVFCDLCNFYLPRTQPQDKVIAQHCRTRIHLERLVRANKYKKRSHHGHSKPKEDEKAGEKGNENATEAKENAEGDQEADANSSPNKKKNDSGENDVDIDEKIWSEVDKDLGDLLREVEPEGKSSDEDEEQQGRYDRFKLSAKEKGNGVDEKSAQAENEDDEEEDEGKEGKSET